MAQAIIAIAFVTAIVGLLTACINLWINIHGTQPPRKRPPAQQPPPAAPPGSLAAIAKPILAVLRRIRGFFVWLVGGSVVAVAFGLGLATGGFPLGTYLLVQELRPAGSELELTSPSEGDVVANRISAGIESTITDGPPYW